MPRPSVSQQAPENDPAGVADPDARKNVKKIIEIIQLVAAAKRPDDHREKDEDIDDAGENGGQRVMETPLHKRYGQHDANRQKAHKYFRPIVLHIHIVDARH